MKSQTLFALTGEARGAARLVYDKEGGTLAVEIAARGAGDCEAWLVPRHGALFRAPLGPAMSAAVPAQAKGAAGIFIASAGKIIASGGNGLTKADMETAALRVQLALAGAKKEPPAPEAQKPPAPKRELRSLEPVWEEPAPKRETRTPEPEQAPEAPAAPERQACESAPPRAARYEASAPDARAAFAQTQTQKPPIPAGRASDSPETPAHCPKEERAKRLMRDASSGPAVQSEAARSIVSMANSLFHPPGEEERAFAYVEAPAPKQAQGAQGTQGAQGMRQNLSNARAPMPGATKHAAQPPFNQPRRRGPRRCPGRR